jgi:hypothetical protein
MNSFNRGIFPPHSDISDIAISPQEHIISSDVGKEFRPEVKKRNRKKILMVLSSKSSGSSAMQHYLTFNYGAHFIPHSEHFEHESLFWTKAASILDLPQEPMYHSEVPIPPSQAMDGLADLLKKNKIETTLSQQTRKEEFFELFFKLCKNTGFPVVEKSPHHLFNASNIQLILDFKEYIAPRADVVLIGLVRNPIDTVYSAWTRWRYDCRAFEHEWFATYDNLRELKKKRNDVAVFHYEEISRSTQKLDEFLECSCGLKKISDSYSFNEKSLHKWKRDGLFHYTLSEEVDKLARKLGYENEDLVLTKNVSLKWTIREILHGWWVRWKQLVRRSAY